MKMEKKAQTWPFWAILGHIVAPSRTERELERDSAML